MSNVVKDFDSEYKNSVEFFENFSNKYYVIINFLNSSINLNLNDLENDKNNIDLVNSKYNPGSIKMYKTIVDFNNVLKQNDSPIDITKISLYQSNKSKIHILLFFIGISIFTIFISIIYFSLTLIKSFSFKETKYYLRMLLSSKKKNRLEFIRIINIIKENNFLEKYDEIIKIYKDFDENEENWFEIHRKNFNNKLASCNFNEISLLMQELNLNNIKYYENLSEYLYERKDFKDEINIRKRNTFFNLLETKKYFNLNVTETLKEKTKKYILN